jgi:hypothetical protein
MTILALEPAATKDIQGTTDDGRIFTSPSFDLGEDILEVAEDGTTSPVEDGTYTVSFTTPEGEDITADIEVVGGKVHEISKAGEAAAEGETEAEPTEMASLAGDDIQSPAEPNATAQTPQDIPQTMEALSYRIEELEKVCARMAAINEKLINAAPKPVIDELVAEKLIDAPKAAEHVEVGENSSQMSAVEMAAVEPDEEEELPKLDGAPIDEDAPKNKQNNFGKKIMDSQSSFLSKLYK